MIPVTNGAPSFIPPVSAGGGTSSNYAPNTVNFQSGAFVAGSQGVSTAAGLGGIGAQLMQYMPYLLIGAVVWAALKHRSK